MKKFLVIGNPIEHSLSPQIHEFWFKKNNLSASYKKQKLNNTDLRDYILKIKNKEIDGMNVTIPFKKEICLHYYHKYLFYLTDKYSGYSCKMIFLLTMTEILKE